MICKNKQEDAQNGTAQQCQRQQACAAENTLRDCPEKEHQIHRIFHCSTETHDRQRANHTQRQYHIACDTTDDQCGYHQNRHKGNIKAAAIQHTAVGFLIYIEDKQPDYERCPKAKRRIQKGKATEAIQKAALKNVIKCH